MIRGIADLRPAQVPRGSVAFSSSTEDAPGRKRLHSRVHVMYFGLGSAHPRQGRQLPPELYTSLVASLYGDPRTLLVGAAGSIGAALVTAWKSAEPLILVCALALAAVACARAIDMWAFARRHRPAATMPQIRRWEMRYVAGA